MIMKLQDIFKKPVDRYIEGVIKADDLQSLTLEVEEYEFTNEIHKRLSLFFGAYNDYQGANGVWISGFFGSGKSHLLKMLALLMENRQVNGRPMLEYFLPKCEEDAMLKAEMSRAVSIPSKSILFNIDQKADTISKTEVDAVLAVFVKVFNEMCGYYGKHGYVAQLERDLDERGTYQDFRQAYQEIAGIAWETGREQIILEKNNIAKAYAQVSGSTAESHRNIIDAYREDYKLSIEDFAEQVNEYIQSQEPGFRLNFFADEVGQYIADNTKLMTNLQTIAESLATKCKGQAWIIVTAQEDMNTVLGEMGKQQTNDFTKIQARFKTRMKLTSQNVDEVIQKRLLRKTSQGETLAGTLYNQQKNNFGTLFNFSDGATTYRNFRDEKHFIICYPFIPYQFSLFQASIETLSQHNAFEGKHSSVGERSMLGVFQEVAIQIAKKEVGELATYDLMFEGIRAALKSQIQRSILLAENELENDFAIRVLKALFLVKYVKGFNATPRNLHVLLQENFERDLPSLRKEIESALSLLEQQTYIQRNGDVYEYLTDEEKDIEQEIKNAHIDSGDTAQTLQEILFDDLIRERKIRYDETGQDFLFTRKMDDRVFGREQELAIHFVTPFSENIDRIETLQAHSMDRSELLVVLPADLRLMQDLTLYKQTEKYVKVNRNTTQQETVLMILNNKGFQNAERFKKVQERVRILVGSARFFVRGTEVEVSGEDPKTRIVKGFHELVIRTYSNLRMLRGVNYSETDIRGHLTFSKIAVLDSDITEPEQEVLNYIQTNKNVGVRTTMKGLVEQFTTQSYGWYLAAIQCIVAILAGRAKIEVRVDSNLLEDDELERMLRNTHSFEKIILDPQAEFSASQIRRLKDFYNHFFDTPPSGNEARTLGTETRDAFRDCLGQLREMAALSGQYPFLSALREPMAAINALIGKNYTYFLEEFPQQEDDLLDLKENILDPIRRFMSGANRAIYDEASRFLQDQRANFDAIGNGKPAQLQAILSSPDCFKGNQMKDAKKIMDGLKTEIETQVQTEKFNALNRIEFLQQSLHGTHEYQNLVGGQQNEVDKAFEDFQYQIQQSALIPVIRDKLGRYETREYNLLLNQIAAWTQKDDQKVIEFVSRRDLVLGFDQAILSSEEDVDNYLQALKRAMLKAIQANKRIRL
jgi:hypothetical protein